MPTPTDVPSAILAIRLSINDTATSNYAGPDDMEAQIDQSRKLFKLSNRNIVTGQNSAFYVQDNAAPAIADPSDPVNGLALMATAPQATLQWYYYWQKFIDPEITQFLDTGLGEVNLEESNLVNIQEGLWTVVSHFASAEAYHTMMARFAETFKTDVEGESYDMSDIYKAYKALHDSHTTDGNTKREEWYKKQSRRFQTYSKSMATPYRPTNLYPRR